MRPSWSRCKCHYRPNNTARPNSPKLARGRARLHRQMTGSSPAPQSSSTPRSRCRVHSDRLAGHSHRPESRSGLRRCSRSVQCHTAAGRCPKGGDSPALLDSSHLTQRTHSRRNQHANQSMVMTCTGSAEAQGQQHDDEPNRHSFDFLFHSSNGTRRVFSRGLLR